MKTKELLENQLPFLLESTDLPFLGERYSGKVRDTYHKGDIRYLIATDRLSCFDKFVTTIPFKGEVLTQLAAKGFHGSAAIVKNHLIDIPDPNVMVVHNCEIVPFEVIVRGYLAGSGWRSYKSSGSVSGVVLPTNMKEYQKLDAPILTPSTKASEGHDMPISEAEIIAGNQIKKKLWEEIREAAISLFKWGSNEATARGLILADTKYEFGLIGGKLILADEIHTLDSSRYWVQEGFDAALAAGSSPKMLDKEPTRQWLLDQGFSGDGVPPIFTDLHRVEIGEHYLSSFERISGEKFAGKVGDTTNRLLNTMKSYVNA